MEVYGGYGYSTEFEIERLYRDAILMSIGEGTNDILRTVVAKSLLNPNPQHSPLTGALTVLGRVLVARRGGRSWPGYPGVMSELPADGTPGVAGAARDAARGHVVYLTERGERLAAIVPAEFAEALEGMSEQDAPRVA